MLTFEKEEKEMRFRIAVILVLIVGASTAFATWDVSPNPASANHVVAIDASNGWSCTDDLVSFGGDVGLDMDQALANAKFSAKTYSFADPGGSYSVSKYGAYWNNFPAFIVGSETYLGQFSKAASGVETGLIYTRGGNDPAQSYIHWFQLVETNSSTYTQAFPNGSYNDGTYYWFVDGDGTSPFYDESNGLANHSDFIDVPFSSYNMTATFYTFVGWYVDANGVPQASPTDYVLFASKGVRYGFTNSGY